MPRPQKSGLDYFPLDVAFFFDPKIKILKARYGVDGVTVYIYLLCEIYRAGYYVVFDDDLQYVMSDDLGMSTDKVMQVLKFLLERSMFDNMLFQSDDVLTSAGIQRRYQLAVRERARKNPVELKGYWLLDESETETFIKVHPNAGKSGNNEGFSGKNSDNSGNNSTKKSKVNKSKVKESKDISPELQSTPCRNVCYELPLIDGTYHQVTADVVDKFRELYPAVDIDQEFRKMIGWLDNNRKNRKTSRGIGRFINGWLCRAQDSARVKPESQKVSGNRFSNFEGRQNDYDAIVAKQMQEMRDKNRGGKQNGGEGP